MILSLEVVTPRIQKVSPGFPFTDARVCEGVFDLYKKGGERKWQEDSSSLPQ